MRGVPSNAEGIFIARSTLKASLRELLVDRQFDRISGLAERRKRALGSLVSLTFDADSEIGWRAVEAMGHAADRIASRDPDFVREHLRRLYWLISEESGGQCWRAPEAMAEIIRRRPRAFADQLPIVVSLIVTLAEEDLPRFKPGVLWAVGRLGGLAEDHIADILSAIVASLGDPNAQVRGMAVWCLGRIGQVGLVADRPALLSDGGAVDFYEDGVLRRTSVAEMARRALDEQAYDGRGDSC